MFTLEVMCENVGNVVDNVFPTQFLMGHFYTRKWLHTRNGLVRFNEISESGVLRDMLSHKIER